MAALLVGLNAASYTQKQKTPDSESAPNRSTFNNGATGTQAFYSLLAETGRKVVRWQESPAALVTAKSNKPAVFVVTGTLRREFTPPEVEDLLRWVSEGGRLILIDREPPEALVTTTANWKITLHPYEGYELDNADATDQKQMMGDTRAVKPVQPSVFTQNVNAVQPSRFAASIGFERFDESQPKGKKTIRNTAGPPSKQVSIAGNSVEPPSQSAPVVQFGSGDKNLVVDAPYGSGRIVYLSDPYIVSNGGISLVDNAQLAINLVAAGDRIIAFDEYHQGYGTDNNRFLQFFAGTPVVAIFLQAAVLIGFVFFSQSRRFARAVPEPEPDRLSKLEYVSAMAELQSRSKAFDLAIENIYVDFRRRVARYFGLDNFTTTIREIAVRIAERGEQDPAGVEDTLFKCEEIIRGEPTNKREVVRLTDELRAIEKTLGLTRSGRTKI
ncbi:MAG: DUF4350 domain-containing protein [Acidobacteriota bacterium]